MPRLHTDQRVGLTKGNPKELEQWSNVFIFDIYTMVVGAAEGRSEEPLPSGSTQIKAPIFLAFGDKEPFIPGHRPQRAEGPRGAISSRRS